MKLLRRNYKLKKTLYYKRYIIFNKYHVWKLARNFFYAVYVILGQIWLNQTAPLGGNLLASRDWYGVYLQGFVVVIPAFCNELELINLVRL